MLDGELVVQQAMYVAAEVLEMLAESELLAGGSDRNEVCSDKKDRRNGGKQRAR